MVSSRKSRALGLLACHSLISVGRSAAVTSIAPSFSNLQENLGRGETATTRLSTAAVVQVVQPRLEPPVTTKASILTCPLAALAQKDVPASMARTTPLVIGRRAGQRSSPVRRNLSHVYAMNESSERGRSPVNVSGSLGIMRTSAATDPVAAEAAIRATLADLGAARSLEPPAMAIRALLDLTVSGRTIVSQCFHTGRSTSFSVSHVWLVSSRM